MWTALVLVVGIVIGWQIPQPEWTKKIWTAAVAWIKTKIGS